VNPSNRPESQQAPSVEGWVNYIGEMA
jgi:hypothetical protein